MQRYYDVAVAALALEAPTKWIDNLLSRHRITGIEQLRQGVTRRLTFDAVRRIALIRALTLDVGLSVGNAAAIAERLTLSGDGTLTFAGGTLTLTVDLSALTRRIGTRLGDAVESAPRRPRGRPPRLRRPAG